MDPLPWALTVAGGILAGIVVGWFGHILAQQRSSDDRQVTDATDAIDKCADIFEARVEYARSRIRFTGDMGRKKAAFDRLSARHPSAVPERILEGRPQWNAYVETEQNMLDQHPDPHITRERLIALNNAAAPVLALIESERNTARS